VQSPLLAPAEIAEPTGMSRITLFDAKWRAEDLLAVQVELRKLNEVRRHVGLTHRDSDRYAALCQRERVLLGSL
jgi:hypothetical protein